MKLTKVLLLAVLFAVGATTGYSQYVFQPIVRVSASNPTYADNILAPLTQDTSGRLRVTGNISCSNCTGTGASATDNSTYTLSTDLTAPGGAIYQATPTTVADGKSGIVRMTTNRVQLAGLADGSGNLLTSSTRGAQQALSVQLVDAAGAQIVSFGGGTQYAEAATAATATGTLGMMKNGTALVAFTGDANGLDVDVTRISGSVAVTNADITTLAGVVTSSRAAVNLISGQAGITGGAGAVGASTPRLTLASDDPAVTSLGLLDNSVSGNYLAVKANDGAGNALTSATRGAQQALSVQIVDASGNQVTTFGGAGGTAAADNSAFSASVTSATPVMGFYHATRDSATDGRAATLAINVNRAALVQLEDASKNGITSMSTTTSSKFGLDMNVLSILGTAPTTAGKLDVKAADGDAFVRSTTASNFNAAVVGNVAHAGADSGNPVKIGCVYNSSAPSLSNGQRSDCQADSAGQIKVSTPLITYNSTQPTLSNGNTSDLQISSRGALIVSTGVEKVLVTPDSGAIVTPTPQAASFTDKSGAVTTGATSQTLAASNGSRKRIVIENPCNATTQNIAAAENLFINFTSAASTTAGTSIELAPCGSYDSGLGPVSTEAVTVTAPTTNHRWTAKEQ